MAEITQGLGTGSNGSTDTGSYYGYVVATAALCLWSGSGTCDHIEVNVGTNPGAGTRLKLWLGTYAGTTFTLAQDDPVVDIDIGSLGDGVLSFDAPTDFTAFAVEEGQTFYVYSATGGTFCTIKRCANATYNGQAYQNGVGGPPYSGTITGFANDSTKWLDINCTGETTGGETIATAGVAKTQPKALGESGTIVSCAGAARMAALAIAVAQIAGTTAAAESTARVHTRAMGQAETTVASAGVARANPRTETGEVVLGVVTRAARVHPRALGQAQVLVDGEGVSKAIARAAGQSVTTLEMSGAPAPVHARAIGEAQLATGNVASQGVSKAHPAATAESKTTVQGQGKSKVQSRGNGQAGTVVDCGGVSRVQPQDVAQSVTTLSTGGTPSKADVRARGISGLVGDGASNGVARAYPRALGSTQATTIHKQWQVNSSGGARYRVRATG